MDGLFDSFHKEVERNYVTGQPNDHTEEKQATVYVVGGQVRDTNGVGRVGRVGPV